MAKNKKKTPAGMPSEIAEKQGLSTNDITEGKDTGSWFMNDNGEVDTSRTTKEMVHDFNEVKGYDQPEPLEGASGTVARGNPGDNAIANPDAPDTADITKRHNEELAQLQNAIGDTNVATGSIVQPETLGNEAESEIVQSDEQPSSDIIQSDEQLPKAPEEANLDFSDYIKNYYGPKNGADYLKSLWANGASGKAAKWRDPGRHLRTGTASRRSRGCWGCGCWGGARARRLGGWRGWRPPSPRALRVVLVS